MDQDTTRLIISLESILKGLNPTLQGLDRIKKKLETVSNVKSGNTAQNFGRVTQASEKQAQALRRLELASAALDARQKRLEVANLRNATAMERARLSAQKLEQQKNRLNQTSIKLEKSLSKVGGTLNRIGSGISSAGRLLTVALSAPLTAIAVLATKNAVEFDSLRRGLEVMAGSADEAGKQLARLREIAKSPGIGFQEAIQGSIRLQAVGFSAEVAERALTQFANAVALTGGGREELERITVQLGQLAAKGKVVAQDLKPIIEAGPAVGQALLQAFGTVNSEDIQKLGLSSQEFIGKLLDALAKLPRAAAGAKNSFENFTDSIFVASVAIGDAILPPLTKLINTLEPLILGLADSFKNLSPQVQTAVIAVAALAAAAGPLLLVLGSLVTAAGGMITGFAALAGVIGAIGFPELLLVLAGLAIQLTALATAAFAVFKAWQTNFLGIQGLVQNAAAAVLGAFNRIRAVFNEIGQRILPTLQSITAKVLRLITVAWENYGKKIVEIVGVAFEFVTKVTEGFLRTFGNFVDLILKLIDGDFRGAWAAFARILLTALGALDQFIAKLLPAIARAFVRVNAFLVAQAIKFAQAGQVLAAKLILSIAEALVAADAQIRAALIDMLVLAVSGLDPTTIAAVLVAKFIAALQRAAAQGVTVAANLGPNVGGEAVAGAGVFRKKGFTPKGATDKGDKQAANALRKAQKDFEEAQNEFTETQAANRIALARTGIQQQFDLTKDGLDRELEVLKANFEDRLASVRKYFAERRRLEESQVDAELAKEKSLSGALFDEWAERRKQIEREFQATVDVINRDPKLKGRAKDLQLQTAETKKQTELAKAQTEFETQNAEVSTRILTLQRKRKDIAADLTREEANLLKEIQKQETELTASVLEERGLSTDAAAIRLRQRFKDAIQDLRVDVTSLAPELQTALNSVDFKTLRARLDELPEPVRDLIDLLDSSFKKAIIQQQSVDIERTLSELRLHEQTIQNKVLDGVLNERDARAAILGLQQISRARLLDILAAQLQIAEATQGQEDEVLRIRAQIQEIERLGAVIDDVGQQINQELFSNIEQGFEGFFQNARLGFDGLKDAAISFGETVLNTFNKIAAQSLTKQLEGLFKPDATNTKGTPGGFLSKLFGLSPKAADTTAATSLASAGTAAGTALTTGGTAAATALTTGGAAASTTLVGSLTAAAASFAAAVTAAGAAFAATVAASSATQAVGGLGGALGAATGLFPAVPGGMVHVVEGGYPEAVLTTDPKHATRQVGILRAYLQQTKGLFGRIPKFEAGGFISRSDAEMGMLESIQRSTPSFQSIPNAALVTNQPRNIRFVFLDDGRDVRNYVNSPEGEQVIVERLVRNTLMKRSFGGNGG